MPQNFQTLPEYFKTHPENLIRLPEKTKTIYILYEEPPLLPAVLTYWGDCLFSWRKEGWLWDTLTSVEPQTVALTLLEGWIWYHHLFHHWGTIWAFTCVPNYSTYHSNKKIEQFLIFKLCNTMEYSCKKGFYYPSIRLEAFYRTQDIHRRYTSIGWHLTLWQEAGGVCKISLPITSGGLYMGSILYHEINEQPLICQNLKYIWIRNYLHQLVKKITN